MHFYTFIRKLNNYKKESGHCFPHWGTCTDQWLLDWIEEIRENNSLLSASEQELLKDIGFEFNKEIANWMNHYFWAKKLISLRGELILHSHESGMKQLADWIYQQEKGLQEGTISNDKIILLNLIGVNANVSKTDKHTQSWEYNYGQLCEFIKVFNRLPKSSKINSTEKDLNSWIKVQLYEEREGRLPQSQKKKLQKIGILFHMEREAIKKSKWLEKFKELKHFYSIHGHSKVDREYNEKLFNWTSKQAGRIDTLDKEQKEKLFTLRFEFKPSKQMLSISAKNLLKNLEDKPILISPFEVPKL